MTHYRCGVRTRPVLVAATAAALVLASCTPSDGDDPAPSGSTSSGTPDAQSAPEGFEDYYTQELDWEQCGAGYECATAEAPVDWADADSGSIELGLKRLPATGDKQGSLLVNPGGPGASGITFVTDARSVFGQPLQEAFDIVGFDPRGVGESAPVVCLDDADKDAALSEDFSDDQAGIDALEESLKEWADACEENTGDQLAHVDTQSAARDMDMLRSALGDEELNYLGFSYGTQLGATYAGLFPETAGRLVLDGAIDTTLTSDEISAEQAVGFENALRAYVEDCQSGADCPLTGDVDAGMEQIHDLLERAYDDPLPTDSDRDLTQTLMFYGIALPLYSQGNWPLLTEAVDEAVTQGTGSTFLYLADFYNDREPDGSFSTNSSEAFRAINCLDDAGNPDMDFMDEQAAEIEAAAPTMGEFFTYNGLTCWDWPYAAVDQEFDLAAAGAPPIVVVGTTNDPATPYVWAEGLADTLDSGVLVTYDGEGHTAYGSSNSCVSDAVESYLVDGDVPEDGLTC